jgi:hypothetical protein
MPTKKTTTARPARKPLTDDYARNVAVAALSQIDLLKEWLAKLEKHTDRIATFIDDHIEELV